jgi:uncharacterized membrane protein (Fun14 family)
MNTKTTLAVIVIALLSLAAMGSVGAIAIDNTATAQNMTANATDTSNMTTFEENTTMAGSGSSMTPPSG